MMAQQAEAGTKPAKARGKAEAAEVKPCTALVVVNAAPTLEELAARLNQRQSALEGMAQGMAQTLTEYAYEMGEMLAAAKKLCGHGKFMPWLERNCPGIPYRTAARYISLLKADLKSANLANLTMTALLQTLPGAKPKEGSYINSLIEEYEGGHLIAALRGLLDRAIGTSLNSREQVAAVVRMAILFERQCNDAIDRAVAAEEVDAVAELSALMAEEVAKEKGSYIRFQYAKGDTPPLVLFHGMNMREAIGTSLNSREQVAAVADLDRRGFWEQAHNAIKRAAAGEEVDAVAELAALKAAREAVAKDLKRRAGAALVKEAEGDLMFMKDEMRRLSGERLQRFMSCVWKLRGELAGLINPYPETAEEAD